MKRNVFFAAMLAMALMSSGNVMADGVGGRSGVSGNGSRGGRGGSNVGVNVGSGNHKDGGAGKGSSVGFSVGGDKNDRGGNHGGGNGGSHNNGVNNHGVNVGGGHNNGDGNHGGGEFHAMPAAHPHVGDGGWVHGWEGRVRYDGGRWGYYRDNKWWWYREYFDPAVYYAHPVSYYSNWYVDSGVAAAVGVGVAALSLAALVAAIAH